MDEYYKLLQDHQKLKQFAEETLGYATGDLIDYVINQITHLRNINKELYQITKRKPKHGLR